MAFLTCTSPCYSCKQLFTYNPYRVPSLTVEGTRQPFCQSCIDRANPKRIANGLEPIVPMPGAYEPYDESEDI
jgi:hypothetical protein